MAPRGNRAYDVARRMLATVQDRDAADWEELARSEPYFPVHTPEGRSTAAADFFATGEADLSALLAGVTSALGREIHWGSALDYGCGAGRLTLPLARRAREVVACDIAPTMLEHARHNAENAGLHNVTYIVPDEVAQLRPASLDFIVSLLVLQYIAPASGYALIRQFATLLAPDGIAALHVPLRRASGDLRRLARWTRQRTASPCHAPASEDVHPYDERLVRREVENVGGRIVARLPLQTGAVLIVEKG